MKCIPLFAIRSSLCLHCPLHDFRSSPPRSSSPISSQCFLESVRRPAIAGVGRAVDGAEREWGTELYEEEVK